MRTLFRRPQLGVAAVIIAASTACLSIPTPAAAWGWHHAWHPGWGWHRGYGWAPRGVVVGMAPPVVVARPPVVYAPPAVVAGPVWIRPHWNGPYWVPGHWG
ncbi:hypothetical protein [Lichenicoccus sp.]|uniref:hypothetical protein n=1 Tax=Lichenicoccus sp. TaxID=2781899 RepID=UPI003D09E439